MDSVMDMLEKLRESCGEISCDECNEQREWAVAEIERLKSWCQCWKATTKRLAQELKYLEKQR